MSINHTLTMAWFTKETLRIIMNLDPNWRRPLRVNVSDGWPGDSCVIKMDGWPEDDELAIEASLDVVAENDIDKSRDRAFLLALSIVGPDPCGRWWYGLVRA